MHASMGDGINTCSFDKCKKKPFKDGLCTVHMPKAPKADAPVYTWRPGLAKGALKPDAGFSKSCESDTPSEPYQKRIEHLRLAGPSNGGAEMVHGISCLHDTQASNNVTVWYSWQGNEMTVWGLGSHSGGSGAGNDSYSMLWCDGKSKSWTRSKKG
jgi:hypothetical protein